MSLRTVLANLARVLSDEADHNPEFAKRLQVVFGLSDVTRPAKATSAASRVDRKTTRPANRRPAAVLDPVALAELGEEALCAALAPLSIEELKDIVADYGMDQKRLVMKWRTPERVRQHIVEISITRAQKGDAFRS